MSGIEHKRGIEFVARLIELTQTDSLKWKPSRREPITHRYQESNIGQAFESEIEGRRLNIFERTWERHYQKKVRSLAQMAMLEPVEYSVERVTVIELEVGLTQGTGWWNAGDIASIPDLWQAVLFKVVGVEEFIDRVLPQPSK